MQKMIQISLDCYSDTCIAVKHIKDHGRLVIPKKSSMLIPSRMSRKDALAESSIAGPFSSPSQSIGSDLPESDIEDNVDCVLRSGLQLGPACDGELV